jgi:hypothetical protein
MTAPIRRWVVRVGLASLLGSAAPALHADTPPKADLLDETKRFEQIASQQVEAEVRLALAEGTRLAESDRAKAIERYQAALARVNAAGGLTEDRRATLVRILQDRIRIAEAAAADADESAAERKAREAIEKLQKLEVERAAANRQQIKDGLAKTIALQKEGKLAEAAKIAKELYQQHPDDVTVQVLNGVSTTAGQLADAKAVQTEKDDRRVLAMRDMDRSAIPPAGDIEFPKDWKEKSARRLKSQQLSPAEMRILQALAQPIQVEFKGSRLQDVVDTISTMTGTAIMIDKPALDENQLSYDTPVSFSLKNKVATRTALRAMLNQLGLTYVVRDGVLQITSLPRARDMMVTKSYYIGDLVAVSGFFGGSTQYGLALDQAQLAQNVGGIVEMITSSLDPMSWQGKGGNGTIGFNIPTMSLIVRQSAEVHMMLSRELYK